MGHTVIPAVCPFLWEVYACNILSYFDRQRWDKLVVVVASQGDEFLDETVVGGLQKVVEEEEGDFEGLEAIRILEQKQHNGQLQVRK